MATYNLIKSTVPSDLVEGTSGNDSISVYGNHSTVNAMGGDDIISVNGGRHDNGIWVEGDESSLIYAGNGNDSIAVVSRGASVYGEGGNDTINFASSYVYADGGAGNDIFYRQSRANTSENVTITTGTGADTLYFDQRSNDSRIGGQFKAIVTDFSDEDAIYLNQWLDSRSYYGGGSVGDYGAFSYTVNNGNVIISDNALINRNGDIIANAITPKFTVTLQGVSDISEVADAKFYRYDGTTPLEITTLGELFGVESSSSSTSTSSTDTTPATNDTNTQSSSGGTTIYNGPVYNGPVYNGPVTINNNTTINETTITNINNTYTYNGGDKIINNYQVGQVVQLTSDYQGIDLNGNSFYVNSSSGQLEIQNSRDKFIGYSGHDNNVVAYSYWASGGGTVDGRGKNQTEILIGGDNANNQIYAGSGGSSLWGGNGGADTLTGGNGYDEFFFAMGSGNDIVQNAGDNDVINLLGVSLSQISGFSYDSSSVDLNFNDGGHLKVESTSSVGYRVENQTFYFNRSTNEWATK